MANLGVGNNVIVDNYPSHTINNSKATSDLQTSHWTKVIYLKPGDEIAVVDDRTPNSELQAPSSIHFEPIAKNEFARPKAVWEDHSTSVIDILTQVNAGDVVNTPPAEELNPPLAPTETVSSWGQVDQQFGEPHRIRGVDKEDYLLPQLAGSIGGILRKSRLALEVKIICGFIK